MEIVSKSGKKDLAFVYIAKTGEDKYIEFVESIQPPIPKEDKWVLIVSTLYGCPVGCAICDAGSWYKGKLSKKEIMDQIEYLILKDYPNGAVTSKKFKIQFARMGEPTLNPNVLDVLRELPVKFHLPGLMPSISSVAPNGTEKFFEELLIIKNTQYQNGRFQLQFSIHSTDQSERDILIPVKKWDFNKISSYGEKFFSPGDRKITLNFAISDKYPLDPKIIQQHFNPDIFLIKLTPINPTITANKNKIKNGLLSHDSIANLKSVKDLKKIGFEVIISIGELEENKIGSNCGQFIKKFLTEKKIILDNAYSYPQTYLERKNN